MRKGTHPRTALGQTAAQMIRRYYLHDVARDSAALTYYLLFAIFPLLIFVSTLLGILELDVDSIVTGLRQIVPGDVAEVVRSYLEYVSGNASRQLMWFSLVFSIWFPMRATGCLLHSLRKAFGKGQPKNILLDQLKIFLFAIWLMVSIGLTLLMIPVGRRALYFVSVLYMLALGRRCPLREVAPGVAGSLAAWMLLSLAFSYYVENLAHYTQLYGSIATIVVVLLWLYMSGTVLILGGELNAVVLHRRTQRRRAAEEKAAEKAARPTRQEAAVQKPSGATQPPRQPQPPKSAEQPGKADPPKPAEPPKQTQGQPPQEAIPPEKEQPERPGKEQSGS